MKRETGVKTSHRVWLDFSNAVNFSEKLEITLSA